MIRVLLRASILFLVLTLLSVTNSRTLRKRTNGALNEILSGRHEKRYYLKKASDGRLKKHDGLVVNIEIEKHKRKFSKPASQLGRLPNALRNNPPPTDKPPDKQVCGWTLQWKCTNSSNQPTPWWPAYPNYYPYYYPYYYNYYYYYPYYWWG